MSAAINTAVFDALDSNHDGVISRAEFGGGASIGGASVGGVPATYAAPAPAYSASPFTYAASTVMPAQTYGAPHTSVGSTSFIGGGASSVSVTAQPQMTYAAPHTLVGSTSFVGGGASHVSVMPHQQMTYGAPQAVTYAAPPVTYSAPPAMEYADMDYAGGGTAGGSSFTYGAPAHSALTYGAPAYTAPTYGAPAYSFGGAAHTVGPTYGAPQGYTHGYTGGSSYTQGKVHQPVLFTQESFLAYQTDGAAALPPPEASVIEPAAVAAVSAGAAKEPEAPAVTYAAPEAPKDTKEKKASKKSSKQSKKSSKKKKGCC